MKSGHHHPLVQTRVFTPCFSLEDMACVTLWPLMLPIHGDQVHTVKCKLYDLALSIFFVRSPRQALERDTND